MKSLRKAIYYKIRLILDGMRYFKQFGLIEASKIYFPLLFGLGTVTVSIQELAHPIRLRSETSDISVFRQLFIDRCYDFQMELSPDSIIDCGANIGLFSVLFANRNPEARIIAVEPEESNFELLKLNTSPYPNIECVQAGVWSKKCHLIIKDQSVGAWAYEVEESAKKTPSSFESVTIDDLMQRLGCEKIDLLKIDIEGAELDVFSENYERWIGAFNYMIVEVHDELRAGCSRAVMTAVGGDDAKYFLRGNNYFFERATKHNQAKEVAVESRTVV